MTDRIGVGVIGASPGGSWGSQAHLPALAASERFRAVAIATAHAETARSIADRFGVELAFGDPLALIAHPAVELVSVCVRVPAHRRLVEAALAAGKHVYCEWPLAVDVEEAEGLALAAERSPGVAAIGLQARYSPPIAHARELVASGGIGRVIGASVHHSGAWPTMLPQGLHYLQDEASGATFLSICGGHAIDALQWVAGPLTALCGTVRTAIPEVAIVGESATAARTSPDQVALAGLIGEAVATIRLHGGPGLGSGFALEINGTDANLVIQAPPGTFGFQMGEVSLFRTEPAGGAMTAIDPPAHLETAPSATPPGPPQTVARVYARIADAIDRGIRLTDFDEAAALHRLLARARSCDLN